MGVSGGSRLVTSGRQTLDGPPILFADLDGTVRHGLDELGRFVNEPADVVIFPEAIERMREWRAAGGIVVGVTNQGGVALGHMTPDACVATMNQTIHMTGEMATILCCVHAPDAGCFCRKPRPGLLVRGALWVEQQTETEVDRGRCLMVGDRAEDKAAAEAAGVPFVWAASWRAGE